MEAFWKILLIAASCFRLNAGLSCIKKCRYIPRYHLAPVKGWMNDPNGFCEFNGFYHLFYQHNPYSSLEPGIANWGHAKSTDLVHWIDEGIALRNDTEYDKTGVFSGSAVIDSNIMYIFYTGHVNLTGENPDHRQTQELVISKDAVHFTKYEHNPIIKGKNLQPNIRDPKVWKHENSWYMVLGNSFIGENNQTLGRVLLFKSCDKINWEQVAVLDESDGYLGYMWECPDFFEINGRFILLFSPQGVMRQGDRFKNLYQTGYIVGYFDYKYNVFTPLTQFKELDFGHDFYATQTILDSNGRRLMVAWMDMWETSYPERADCWTGQMTFVRSLSLTEDNRLLQNPVKEIKAARGKALFLGNSCTGVAISLPNKAGEVFIIASRSRDFVLYIGSNTSSVQIKYEFIKGRVSVKRDDSDDGLRRTKYRPLSKLLIRILIDASSIEVFFGKGEVVFSCRFFIDDNISVRLGADTIAEVIEIYEMKTTLYNSKLSETVQECVK